jgi:hypothetical protein
MSQTYTRARTPWIFWPFVALWKLVAGIIELTGRLLAVIVGLVLLLVGILLSITIVGAIIGIPLALFGFMLMVRGFF